MKRFLLSAPPDRDGSVFLSGKDYHYLARVRRIGPGDIFKALLPSGEEIRVRVRSLGDGCLAGDCLFNGDAAKDSGARPGLTGESPPDALPPVILFQALPKGAKMDLIVRQAAEGGIAELVPFVSAYSVPKPRSERTERWKRIVKEARQQSGSPVATLIRETQTPAALMAYWDSLRDRRPGALGLLFHHAPLETGTFHGYLNINPELVVLAIGPEGGFSPAEAVQFMAAGFKPLVMGETTLRTETAALYAAAAVRIILLERASWTLKDRFIPNG
ncbi:MAG: RsmE family RNA methyltransferase [Spirochaetaceae bacterium]|nr:RsmE family RNA methyltransferase [Spirochaetaceae bacterium]